MVWLDYALLGVMLLSALLGLLRGLVKEALSLGGWVLSFWAAMRFGGDAAAYLEGHVAIPELRQAAAFFGVFVAVLLVVTLVAKLVSRVVRASPLNGFDRGMGLLFGLARGMILIMVVVVLGGLTPLAETPAWQASLTVYYLQGLAAWVMEQMGLELSTLLPA